ncbi:unnamed protein product, partial [Musa banksii]
VAAALSPPASLPALPSILGSKSIGNGGFICSLGIRPLRFLKVAASGAIPTGLTPGNKSFPFSEGCRGRESEQRRVAEEARYDNRSATALGRSTCLWDPLRCSS